MKSLLITYEKLMLEERWDIDYHLPPIEIKKYNKSILTQVINCADIITEKRNPTLNPDDLFLYVDISSIDVVTGAIVTPQELIGADAPSRARKVIRTGDVIISTCRPTRGAIAIIPEKLDNQICSTGFSVIRAKDGINKEYLHFILRSAIVKEQFRKFSTGSSYPAILDSDVNKTIIPLPSPKAQDTIAEHVVEETLKRNQIIEQANTKWGDEIKQLLTDIESL